MGRGWVQRRFFGDPGYSRGYERFVQGTHRSHCLLVIIDAPPGRLAKGRLVCCFISSGSPELLSADFRGKDAHRRWPISWLHIRAEFWPCGSGRFTVVMRVFVFVPDVLSGALLVVWV